MQQRFRELLEAASNAAGGSDYALAKALAVPRQTVSNWRTGHKPCPPDMQALMAQIAGLDPLATLARATIEKAKEPERQERLKDALKKAWARTGGVATFGGFVTAVAAAIATMLTPVRADAMGLAATSDNV